MLSTEFPLPVIVTTPTTANAAITPIPTIIVPNKAIIHPKSFKSVLPKIDQALAKLLKPFVKKSKYPNSSFLENFIS